MSKTIFRYISLSFCLLFYSCFLLAHQSSKIIKIEHCTEVPLPAIGQFVGMVGNILIVAGGEFIDGSLSDSIFVRTEDGNWHSFVFRNPASFGAAVVAKGSLICVGGKTQNGYSTQVVRINWKNGNITQTRLADIPSPRIRSGLAVLNDELFLVCGRENEDIVKANSSFFSLDLKDETAQWISLPDFPGVGRIDPMVCAQFGAIYVIGGQKIKHGTDVPIDFLTLSDSWSYRPSPTDGSKRKGWIKIADIHDPLCAGNIAPTGQGHILIFGAVKQTLSESLREYVPSTAIWSYHTVTDSWVKVGEIDGYLPHSHIAFSKNESMIVGGIGMDTMPSGKVERLKYQSSRGALDIIDYGAIMIYLILLIGIGTFFSKRSGTTSQYFLGGRKIPWWAVGISLYATGTSAISFLAIPTKTFVTNQAYGIGSLWGPLFMIATAFLIVPILRGIDITSTYEYLEKRFNVLVRIMGALLSIAFQLGGRMSIILLLPSLALSAVTGINVFFAIALMGLLATLYTVMGGISAVIWTDVLQVVVLLGGTAVAFGMMISGTDGGMDGFLSINMQYGKFDAIDLRWDMTVPVIWVFMLNQLMTQANFPSDQVMVQRVLTTPNVRSARRSYILLGLIVVPGTLLFHLLGSGLFSFFHSHPALLNPTMENIQVFPVYIVEVLPAGITGILIAALFAASMSTLDSGINSVTTVLLSDFYQRFFPNTTESSILGKARYITAIVGVIATGIALLMARFDIKSMFDLWMNILALIGGGFGGVFLLGIFSRRANSQGVIMGAICSIIITIIVKYYTNIHFMLYTSVAVFSCICTGLLFSYFFPRTDKPLDKLTIYTLKS